MRLYIAVTEEGDRFTTEALCADCLAKRGYPLSADWIRSFDPEDLSAFPPFCKDCGRTDPSIGTRVLLGD
jgi:hypothetical protein